MSLRSEVIRIYNELIASAKKITDLPAATTPLAGTELIEIVQGGVNKKVAASDVGGGGGSGTVESVTGDGVDNTDPDNPVISFPTASDIGLGNVDNTSDANKPVSTAQATADGLRVLKSGDTMSGNLALGGNKVTGLAAASGNGEAVRYEQHILKQDLVNSATALTDAGTIDLTAIKHTLASSSATRTFTISYTGDDITLEVTLSNTAAVYTFPAAALCSSEGVASGDNTLTLAGASGDKYIIAIKKIGSAYYVVSKNFGQ